MGMSSPCVNCGADFRVCIECDWYNGEWISKDEYEARLKADMVAMLEELKKEIVEIAISKATVPDEIFWNIGADAMKEEIGTRIQEKINSLKENT